MRMIYFIDYCFQQTPDGRVWTDTAYSVAFWKPYLTVYDEIVLVCRINYVATASDQWLLVTGEQVQVRSLTNYKGPITYIHTRGRITREIDEALALSGVVMLRVPSNIARCAVARLNRMNRTYGVDVVGDPWHAMAPGVVNVRGRVLFRWLFTRSQRSICDGAAAVTYVASTLPALYPCRQASKCLVCSDVRLDSSWIRATPRVHEDFALRLITVATLSQMYKGIDVLLHSLALCKNQGIRFHLTIVGTGRLRGYFERLAASLCVKENIEFRGAIPWGPEMMQELDLADIFVLPSLVEVMPRALLEAMARGLPALATRVGAVSHVLANEDIVEAGNARELADRLLDVATSPERMNKMSSRNLTVANLHREDALLPMWIAFHRELCQATLIAETASNRPQFGFSPEAARLNCEALAKESVDATRQ
jgi:glycosyltransferase involved in cell wall biosynthesis